MIRLKDIAARAGVSVMTVSKVMRNAHDISAATKTRIRKLAREMGYVPDSMAQGLRNRTTKLFGLVISATTDPIFSRMVMAVEEKIHLQGYNLILAHSLNTPEREETIIRQLMARRVDGLFISPVYRMEPRAVVYEELRQEKIPTVLLGQKAAFCESFANVEGDDLGSSYAATRHLLALGHQRIAFLGGHPVSPAAQERLEGYRRALREANIQTEDQLVFRAGATIEEGQQAALQMLQEQTRATAVQAVNDLVAIGAANILLNQGLDIPGDLSLVGFGNILVSEHYRVPLTTVRQPKLRLGEVAVDMMNALLQGQFPGTRRLSAELIIRQSTGPAPARRKS
jgi:DNA-binding LacI/PurR family transcriptional regulator